MVLPAPSPYHKAYKYSLISRWVSFLITVISWCWFCSILVTVHSKGLQVAALCSTQSYTHYLLPCSVVIFQTTCSVKEFVRHCPDPDILCDFVCHFQVLHFQVMHFQSSTNISSAFQRSQMHLKFTPQKHTQLQTKLNNSWTRNSLYERLHFRMLMHQLESEQYQTSATTNTFIYILAAVSSR